MSSDEIERATVELEGNIDKLQALYNQYFMGIEKLQPSVMHTAVERNIRRLRKTQIQNTAQKFRLQTLFQRFNTLNNHWRRVCREIEEGTYRRHIDRAKRRQEFKRKTEAPQDPIGQATEEQLEDNAYDLSDEFNDLLRADKQTSFDTPAPDGLDLDEPFKHASMESNEAKEPQQKNIGTLDDPFGDGIWPETPSRKAPARNRVLPPPPPKKPPPPKPAGARPAHGREAIDARRAHAIFRTFVSARSRCNERTDNLTLDKITKSLNKQYQARGGEVDFKVVIKNGKAAIKTVPKKNE